MKRVLLIGPCILLGLTACSSQLGCANAEIRDLVLQAAEESAPYIVAANGATKTEQMKAYIQDAEVRNIATDEQDASTGSFYCSAQLYSPDTEAIADIEYGVQPVEHGEDGNNVQILYDKAEFSRFGHLIASAMEE